MSRLKFGLYLVLTIEDGKVKLDMSRRSTEHRELRLFCMWALGAGAIIGATLAAIPPCNWPVMAFSGIYALVAIAWSPK